MMCRIMSLSQAVAVWCRFSPCVQSTSLICFYRFLLPSSSVWLLRSRGGIDGPGPAWLVCSEQQDILVLTGVTCDLKNKRKNTLFTVVFFCMSPHVTDCYYTINLIHFVFKFVIFFSVIVETCILSEEEGERFGLMHKIIFHWLQ